MLRWRLTILAPAAVWLALCSAAFAAEPEAPVPQTSASQTSAGQPAGAPVATHGDAVDQQIDAWVADGQPPAAPAGQGPTDAPPPRAIHGEAGVSIGSNGYRNAYVAADIPIGQRSDLGVAVGDTELPSRHGRGGGSAKSLALSLYIDTSKSGASCGAPHWGQPLAGDAARADCASGPGALPPGLAAMAAQSALR